MPPTAPTGSTTPAGSTGPAGSTAFTRATARTDPPCPLTPPRRHVATAVVPPERWRPPSRSRSHCSAVPPPPPPPWQLAADAPLVGLPWPRPPARPRRTRSGATPAPSRRRRTCSTVKILNRTNGQYPDSQVYWSFNGQTHSIAEQPYFDMPANSAGRMYFYLGSPNSQYSDFIEFTVGPTSSTATPPGSTPSGSAGDAPARPRRLRRRRSARTSDVRRDRDATFQQFQTRCRPSSRTWRRSRRRTGSPRPAAPAFRTGGQNANYFTRTPSRSA